MMPEQATPTSSDSAFHFCVFIHGLWGSPGHLTQVSKALQSKFGDSNLHVFIAKKNIGNFTYDGVELGAERVTKEIEDEFTQLEEQGKKITKISVVGYSLGGLIARYAVGLLYSKGYFERFEPVNFTTFATPHLGTRTPLLGWHNQFFNVVGPRTLSASGQQLWAIDNFQDTGRPILSILADPQSIFMRALTSFKHRILYANIVNDRAVPFYTACIEDIDPFVDLDGINVNYVPELEDVILEHPSGDPPHTQPMASKKTEAPTFYEAVSNGARNALNKAPFYIFLGTFGIFLGAPIYFANAGIQSFKSSTRISEHAEGKGGIEKGRYKVQLMLEEAQRHAEKVIGDLTPRYPEEHLPNDDSSTSKSQEVSVADPAYQQQTGNEPVSQNEDQDQSDRARKEEMNGITVTEISKPAQLTPNGNAPTPHLPTPDLPSTHLSVPDDDGLAYGDDHSDAASSSRQATTSTSPTPATSIVPPPDTLSSPSKMSSHPNRPESPQIPTHRDFPTLALTPEQFAMKASLDAVGWKKYPVHIKKANHSHAAIIVRMQRPGFGEGKVVSKHWVERFEI